MSLSNRKNKGFTLIELLITISIVMVMLSIIMTSQSTYASDAALANQADSISLSLSEAQAYGTSVKNFSTSSFKSGFGVEFNITGSGSNDAYISFGDINDNRVYDSGWNCPTDPSSECYSKTTLTKASVIDSICEIPVTGSESCNVGRVDISFKRPITDARIVYYDSVGVPMNFVNPIGVRIKIKSPAGRYRSVIVYNTGQVSVQ